MKQAKAATGSLRNLMLERSALLGLKRSFTHITGWTLLDIQLLALANLPLMMHKLLQPLCTLLLCRHPLLRYGRRSGAAFPGAHRLSLPAH
jgi:hypothetical protein